MGVSRKKMNTEATKGIGDDSNNWNMALDMSKIPLESYEIVEGDNTFNIIPFEVTSKFNNLVYRKQVDIGDAAYVLPLWMHKNVGIEKKTILCAKKNHGSRCPVCEAEQIAWDEYNNDKSEANKRAAINLKAKLRVYYNVMCVGGKHDGEVCLFDASDFKFQAPLNDYISETVTDEDDIRNGMKRVRGIIDFTDIDNGYVVKFTGKEDTFDGKKYIDITKVRLQKRKEAIPDSVLEKVVSLDEALIVLDYDTVDDMFNGNVAASAPTKEESGQDDDNTPPFKEDKDDRDELPVSPKEEKEENPCPYDHDFGDDFDGTKDCDNCMDDHMDCWKKCRKESK